MNSEQKMREALQAAYEAHQDDFEQPWLSLAAEALASPACEHVGLTNREVDGLLDDCIAVLHCHLRNSHKNLLTRLRAARRTIAAHEAKRRGAA